ncbi:mycofactocin-coupled SDR family oxidoreductase [Streptomyces canus]|uniref:mycofactocin-coupled SDR family oxidoreductase n=1 Tax=Streptomyces canus TaxID=58343 RepID=UPI003829A62A
MMGRVAGKVALITGAARGQGRSHAIRLAEEGADIIAVDICAPVEGIGYAMATPDDLRETEKQVCERGRRIITAEVDIREGHALSEAVREAVGQMGGLDVVVANAGVGVTEHWDEFTHQQWDAVIGVNLTGTWNTVLACVPHLLARGGGSVIAISSVAGVVGLPFVAPYVASKHGVVGLTRALSNELADRRVRVNAICPTGVAGTGILDGMGAGPLASASDRVKSSYLNALQVDTVEKSDVSDAVLYLASDESRYVTGITLPVDAGLVNL